MNNKIYLLFLGSKYIKILKYKDDWIRTNEKINLMDLQSIALVHSATSFNGSVASIVNKT